MAIIVPMLFGLGCFFAGLQFMKTGLHQLAGDRLQDILTRFTRTPTHGFLSGTVVTLLLQSSSAVTLMTVGLTQAGVLAFPQTIGIVLGTNIGTTLTTQLLALHIDQYSLPLFIIGLLLWFIPHHIARWTGLVFAGFGAIFMGMQLLKQIATPLQQTKLFQMLMEQSTHQVLIAVLLGAIFTALIHNSAAMTAMAMSLTSEGVMPLTIAIAIVLGSNIGTCVTAWMASWGAGLAAKRVAWSHILLNVFGVLAFLPLLDLLASTSRALSENPAAQVAHASTLFNVICSIAILPFARPFARLIELVIRHEKS